MKLIDREKLFDDLCKLPPTASKEACMKVLAQQPTIDAIPVEFAREHLEACSDEGYRAYKSGIRHLLIQWHKENEGRTI